MNDIRIILRTTLPQIRIDSSDTRAEIGLKSPRAIREEGVALGKQAVLEGIGRRADEGNRFQRIENNSNPVAEIAAEAMEDNIDYNVGLIPKTPPRIDFVEGKVEISAFKSEAGSVATFDVLA